MCVEDQLESLATERSQLPSQSQQTLNPASEVENEMSRLEREERELMQEIDRVD